MTWDAAIYNSDKADVRRSSWPEGDHVQHVLGGAITNPPALVRVGSVTITDYQLKAGDEDTAATDWELLKKEAPAVETATPVEVPGAVIPIDTPAPTEQP